MESCILPCSFQAGDDVLIHWYNVKAVNTEESVHSYYYDKDQLTYQNQRFRGRTSLFRDQISRGNASLQLTGVEVQDQGRYKCYTSTSSRPQESFINLRVDGVKVQDQGRYKCYTSTISGNKESFINLRVDDVEVSCIFMGSCILPCSFQAGDREFIHWFNVKAVNTEENVHSYYYDKDQLTQQNQRFRGRTSLFRDQISRGNASLQLTGVEVQDQGRYKCYTSTSS
eukprot:superscaffoldBa00016385_g26837